MERVLIQTVIQKKDLDSVIDLYERYYTKGQFNDMFYDYWDLLHTHYKHDLANTIDSIISVCFKRAETNKLTIYAILNLLNIRIMGE